MSTYLDEQVVSLKFDNQQFERNAKESMGTLDKLKNSLNFKGAVQGLDALGDEANNLNKDFGDTIHAVEALSGKFSVLEVAAITAISRITNRVLDLGEKLATSLSIDQIAEGWNKYESKITSVQTIMAATASTWEANARSIGFAGTQMEYVSAMLDKLNWFSDETSYSFTDMTSNIGKFTSAGVDLNKAVEAMEGISVWAAKSGQNAQSASRAYYNLAQAISVGSVKLIDWKSIENANMATMEFKETAIKTAEAMGTLKKTGEGVWEALTGEGGTVTIQDFNSALKDNWFTSDVLMKTLNEYGKAATLLADVSDTYGVQTTQFLNALDEFNESGTVSTETLKELGMTMEDVTPIFDKLNSEEYKLSLSAFRAAQEAKTFSEVISATKDAVSTGWMNTWELIFGNYEEAKRLWSDMAEEFYTIFAGGAEGRNNILKQVMYDPWDQIVERIEAAGISSEKFSTALTKELKEAGIPIDELVTKYGSIKEAIKHVDDIKSHVINTLKSFMQPIKEGADSIGDATERLKEFQTVVNQVIRGEFKSGQERVKKLTDAGWNYATVQGLVNKVWEKNGHTWKDTTITVEDLVEVMSKLSDEELDQMGITRDNLDLIADCIDEFEDAESAMAALLDRAPKLSGTQLFFNSLMNIAQAVSSAITKVREAWDEAFPNRAEALYGFLEGFNTFTARLKMNEKTLDKFKRTVRGIFSLFGLAGDVIGAIVRTVFPNFQVGLNTMGDGFLSITANIGDAIYNFRQFAKSGDLFGKTFSYLKTKIMDSIENIKAWLNQIKEIPLVKSILDGVSEKIAYVIDIIKDYWNDFTEELHTDNGNIITAIEKIFKRLGESVEKLFKKVPYIDKIKEAFSKFIGYFRTAGKNVIEGLVEGIKNFDYKALWNSILEVAKGMVKTFCDYMGIHSPATRWIQLAIDCIKGLIVGIATMINKAALAIRDFVKALFTEVDDDMTNPRVSPFEKIKEITINSLTKVMEFFKMFFGNIGGALGKVAEYVSEHNVFDKILSAIRSILSVILLLNMVRISGVLPEILISFANSFRRISKSVRTYFSSLTVKNYAVIARNLTLALALIALSVYGLAKLPQEQFDNAMKALKMFEEIIIALGLVMAAVIAISSWGGKTHELLIKSFKWTEGTKINPKGVSTVLIQMAGFILAVGASMYLFVQAFNILTDVMSKDTLNSGVLWKSLGIMAGILVTLGVMAFVLSKVAAATQTSLIGLAAVLMAVTASMYLVLMAIQMYFVDSDSEYNLHMFDSWKNVGKVFASFFVVLLTIAGLITGLWAISKFVTTGLAIGNGLALSVMLISIGLTLHLVLGAISSIINTAVDICKDIMSSNKEYAEDNNVIKQVGDLIKAILIGVAAILLAILVGMAALSAALKKNKETSVQFLGASLFLFAFAAALLAMVETLNRLYQVLTSMHNIPAIIGSILILVGGVAGIIIALLQIKKTDISTSSLTLFGVAAVIATLAGAIWLICQIENTWKAIGIMAGLMVFITVMMAMLGLFAKMSRTVNNEGFGYSSSGNANFLGQFANLLGIVGMILALTNAVVQLQDVSWESIIKALGSIVVVISILMAVTKATATVDSWTGVGQIIAMAAGIWIVAQALSSLLEVLDGSTGNNAGKMITAVLGVGLLTAAMSALAVVLGKIAIAAPEAIVIFLLIAGAIALINISVAALIASISLLIEAFNTLINSPAFQKFFSMILKGINSIIDAIKEAFGWLERLLILAGAYSKDDIIRDYRKENGIVEERTGRRRTGTASTSKSTNMDTSAVTSVTMTKALPIYASSGERTMKTVEKMADNYNKTASTEREYYKFELSNKNQNGYTNGVTNIQDSINEQVASAMSSYNNFNLSGYEQMFTDQADSFQTEINDTLGKIPLVGNKLVDAINVKSTMNGYLNGINYDLDMNTYMDDFMGQVDLSGFNLELGDYTGLIGDYTGLLGDYTYGLGNTVTTLEQLAEIYKDYKLENNTPLKNPDEIKKKEWSSVLKETGYASKEEYIAAYEMYLKNLQNRVNPDDIKFTDVSTKDAYVEAYNNYMGYLNYLDQVRTQKVEQMLYDYLYLNPDKRFAQEDLVNFINDKLSKHKIDDDKLENFVENMIDEFYRNIDKYVTSNSPTPSGNKGYAWKDNSGVHYASDATGTTVVPSYSSSGSIYSYGTSTATATPVQVQFPDIMRIDDENILKAIAANARLIGLDISRLGNRIEDLEIVLDSQVLVGQLSPKISRTIASNTANAIRGM